MKIYAVLGVDIEAARMNAENNGLNEKDLPEYVEKEFGKLEQSGITLGKTVVYTDDESFRRRYVDYVMKWAMGAADKLDNSSPLSFGEWRDREFNGIVTIVSSKFARFLIDDLGNGEPTHNDERTSRYYTVARGRGTNSGKECKVALVERTEGYGLDKDYYELHLINDIDMSACKLFFTDHLSEQELIDLLETILRQLEDNNLPKIKGGES